MVEVGRKNGLTIHTQDCENVQDFAFVVVMEFEVSSFPGKKSIVDKEGDSW